MPFLLTMLRRALLLIVFLFSLPAFAQQKLQGRVADSRHAAIPFASIAIYRAADSMLLKTALADSNGSFELPEEAVANAYLQVSAAGFDMALVPLAGTGNAQLSITLERSHSSELSGVIVSGRKPLIEHRVDRTVFNVENSATTSGSDALEALKRAPGVLVSNNNISIAGKSSVMVMINDRLQQLSGDELASVLRSIPADNLSRIEVITTPPARYDAAGNSGIINIVTKKNRRDGLNGNVMLGAEKRTKAAGFGNGNFNYRNGDWNVYGNTNYFTSYRVSDPVVTTQFPTQQYRQQAHQDLFNLFARSQLGVDYNITPNAVLGALYTYGAGGWDYRQTDNILTEVRSTATGGIDSTMRTHAQNTDHGHRNVGNLNFDWKLDTSGRRLTIDLEYFHRTGDKVRNFTAANFLDDGSPTGYASDNHTTGYQLIEITTAKADMDFPTKLAQLAFGGKATFIHDVSDNNFSVLNNGNYETDPAKTDRFDYTENTQALYANANRTFGKWQAQLGLRAEYTQTRGYSATLGQANRNEYYNIFPTFFLQYSPNDAHAFGFNVNRRIERPSFWLLNPFRSYNSPNAYESGNPFLQPSYSNNAELSYTYKSNYTAKLYTQQIRHYFSRVSLIDSAAGAVSFTQANTGSFDNYGLTLSASYTPFSWWEGSLELNGFYSRFSSSFYGAAFTNARPTVYAQGSNSFTLNKAKTLIIGMDFWLEANHQDDFDFQYGHGGLSVGIKALFFNKTLTLNLAGDDLLRTDVFHVKNQLNGTEQYSYYDERSLHFTAAWKFGNAGIKAKRERREDSDAGRR